ncbi:hypothetical protein DFH09DRAFT_1089229 [Mycena vulgaris]|nr:hypothetical protein DFH09DRAFT_1089229 [Mycena vulgaris]
MPENTLSAPVWPPVRIRRVENATPVALPVPPQQNVVPEPLNSLRKPLQDKTNQKQYGNGYVAAPKEPSYTPYRLPTTGRHRQRAFAILPRESLATIDPLSADAWNFLARQMAISRKAAKASAAFCSLDRRRIAAGEDGRSSKSESRAMKGRRAGTPKSTEGMYGKEYGAIALDASSSVCMSSPWISFERYCSIRQVIEVQWRARRNTGTDDGGREVVMWLCSGVPARKLHNNFTCLWDDSASSCYRRHAEITAQIQQKINPKIPSNINPNLWWALFDLLQEQTRPKKVKKIKRPKVRKRGRDFHKFTISCGSFWTFRTFRPCDLVTSPQAPKGRQKSVKRLMQAGVPRIDLILRLIIQLEIDPATW